MVFDDIKPSCCSVGFFDSRSKYKNCDTSAPRECYQYEIEIYTEDGGDAMLNGNTYNIKKNHVLFCRPGSIRNSNLHFKCFYLHISISDEKMNDYLNDVPEYFGIYGIQAYYNLIQTCILTSSRHDYESDMLFRSKVTELILKIHKDAVSYSRSEQSSAVFKAERYIDDNFTEKITLSDLSEHVHLSPNYFQRLFSKVNGISPREYITEKRLKYAAELILTSDLDMLEVAMSSGFSSQSYFNYCFKKKMGISPIKFREKQYEKYNI